MNILMIRNNPKEYIAKIYWSLQEGLRQVCNLIAFGENQDFFDKTITKYSEIISLCYGNKKPDLIITNFNYIKLKFEYEPDVTIQKAMILGDYWAVTNKEKFKKIVEDNFSYVFCLFYEALEKYNFDSKFIFTPPSILPDLFKDWNEKKKYSVGFLGDGCSCFSSIYPERWQITQLLIKKLGNDFFTACHPGWGYFPLNHQLVGEGFSKAINSCKMFVSTPGIIGHCNPKYYEIAASGSLLLAKKCLHIEKSGFVHEKNCYIFETNDELLEAISFYNNNEDRKCVV
jgi:hypothetical protein